jgi:LytTr DNA-binding domain
MTIDEARNNKPDALAWWLKQAPQFAVTIGVGVLLALSGAFGTDQLPLLGRLAYWVPVMLLGSLIGSFISYNILSLERWTKSAFLAWLIMTVAVGFIMAPLVYGIGLGLGWARLSWASATYHLVPSLAISGLMAGIGVFIDQVPQVTHQAPPTDTATTPPARPAFLDRLPAKLYGAEVHAVEAQDHYLKVYTSRGTDMILMRLADAVKELEGVEGARVHRSWWVARASVDTADKNNGKAMLTVSGGLTVPVSRSYARALREDGWF